MFLCRLQKIFICTERNSLRRALSFRNGIKNVQQHMRFVFSAQYPQNVGPDSFTTDFTAVEKAWKQNQNNGMNDFLFQCFEKENDCFSFATHLISQACHSNSRSSIDLVITVMNAFEQWQENNGVSQQPTPQLQSKALMAALSTQNRFLVQLVCNVFRINGQCDFIDDVVETCMSHKKNAEAAVCALVLKVQGRYPIEKILLPIINEGRLNLAVMYIGGNKDLLMKLIKSLDNSLPSHKQSAQMEKLAYKRLSSILTRFDIPPETCPNLFKLRSKITLGFLMRKRYSEKIMTPSCWEEMTMELLRDSPRLRITLIWKLINVQDFATALKMASTFNIPAEEWPPALKNFVENAESPDSSHNSEDLQQDEKKNQMNSRENEHLSLQLDKSCLKYVETAEDFEDCLSTISKNYDVVGFDSEWKPGFNISKCRLALMQLAVKDKVYLLDFLALRACLNNSHWDNLIINLFGNPKILKLGCGLTSDVEVFVKSFQGTVGTPIKFSSLLDVAIFFQKFRQAYPWIFPDEEGKSSNNNNTLGLSKICAHVLGRPLKKQHQFSNWEIRPLGDSQLHYAALDAYCLLQIYDKLQEIAKEKNLNYFESIHHESLALSEDTLRLIYDPRRRRTKWSRCNGGFEIQPVMTAKRFKVLMDPKLEILGKELKKYGVDVTFLESSADCSDALELAKAENRIILASSLLYEQLNELGNERIAYKISEEFTNDQSGVAHVFQKFNVRFQADDISYSDDVHSTS